MAKLTWQEEQKLKRTKVWDVDVFIEFFEKRYANNRYVSEYWKEKGRVFDITDEFLKNVDRIVKNKIELTSAERYLAQKCNMGYEVQGWARDPWKVKEWLRHEFSPSNARIRNRIQRMRKRIGYTELLSFCKWMREEKEDTAKW